MFKLGDLLEHKKPHIIGTRMVVSIGSIYYTTKMIDTYYDGAIVYIPLEFERNYKCVGNILEKKGVSNEQKKVDKTSRLAQRH